MAAATLQQALASLERGETDAAIAALERLVQRTPLHVAAHLLLARAYEAEARWPEAQSAWQHAYFLMPGSPAIEEGLWRRAAPPASKPEGGGPERDFSFDDLDHLIEELETARIVPQPDFDEVPAPDLEDDDVEDIVSETLARIYVAQEQYAEAARVYARLAEQDPARAHEYRQKAGEMHARAEEAGHEGERARG